MTYRQNYVLGIRRETGVPHIVAGGFPEKVGGHGGFANGLAWCWSRTP
jgi:hypothetical protein